MSAFEQLRDDGSGRAEPDARFAAALRRRIEAELAPGVELPARRSTDRIHPPAPDQEATMTDTETTASTTQVITPYITVHDGAAALEWYAAALGATETMRYTGDDGRVGHAEIIVHGARIFLSDP